MWVIGGNTVELTWEERKSKIECFGWCVEKNAEKMTETKKVKRKIEGIKCNYNVIMNSTSRD